MTSPTDLHTITPIAPIGPIAPIALVALVGTGATALLDLWLAALRRAGVPALDIALIGRWVGHLARGRFVHAAIRQAAPIRGERAWGWLVHYAVGIVFAALLVAVQGSAWLYQPTLLPALAAGVLSVAAPLAVMQPSMGAGFASSRTAAPLKNSLRSLANHTVFGFGLYASAYVTASAAAAWSR